MFNSKKKQAAAEAEQAQRAAIDTLRTQLDDVRSERAALENRIATLATSNEQLDSRLRALDQGVVGVGDQLAALASSHADTNHRVRAIDERLGSLDARTDRIDDRVEQIESLTSELDAINERLRSFDAASALITPTPPPPPGSTSSSDPSSDELRTTLDELSRQTSSIDARVTSVSLELANQLTELSNDIDELNRRRVDPASADSTAPVDTAALEARITERLDVALDEVLDSTERLAAEQARYEIQFRADLAELAERLRRPGSA